MRNWSLPLFCSFVVTILLVFQNCGKAFRASENLTLKTAGLSAHISHDAGSSLSTGEMVHFHISGKGLEEASYKWSHEVSGTPDVCDDENDKTNSYYMLTCPQSGNLTVYLTVTKKDSSTQAQLQLAVTDTPATPSPAPSSNIAEYRIASGTGQRSWNTQTTAIHVFVDQTLRIVNDDSIPHRLHTNGSPFPHGDEIAPGGNRLHVVQSAFNSDTSGPLYDHIYQNVNPRPNVWIYSYNGATLYQTNCQSCHGNLATSTRRNRTAQQITDAINSVPQMAALRGRLNAKEIEALAFKLKD